ncbi:MULTISPECIES: hypothetical protein [Mycobacteriaceae]|uniref:Uncharacterized protein n=1 Tax=Mycolicibacterium phocaicum TaxID=319706 RepID=A0AA94UG62_9MYCO|nr:MULTISPECIES: hypothetical protein [Mycolicibacterium]MCX8555634.1 hypothetical protein [Mycolicibacterium mucogenicum]MDX1877644.1 hypothetical protein [Mycolicibacterium sp. 141076]RUP28634.1 MAG: hypothetical protein EKK51_23070 [Mycolicibacterium sp.]TLH80969.1 hypothetical protein C1S79_00745 [Mycolicibacterium phocaicum]UCZ60793.1 hypothetical protein LHJ73_00645 [Mycolicibacterium phocaicum]
MKHSVATIATAGALVAGLAWLPAPQAHAERCIPLDGTPMVLKREKSFGIGKDLQLLRTYTYTDGMVNWAIEQDGGVKYNTGFGFGARINAVYIPELNSSGSVPGAPGEYVNIDSWHFHEQVLVCPQ